ncbi:hypothetical protein SAMN05444506_101266 [Pseudomonas syringae]|uniref:Uncharacterized protein n=1 Tax=Pseudomonas syringae pv. tomato TaxID=323 RepID=A0AAV1BRF7_PSEUB|nr:hypothetical protein PST407_04680 [Pseudomonas syringae pv. tomato]CAI8961883.1 hypothetical protein DAPPPG215_23865 [Pseudomonas syringae pv. tomato]SDY06700.1 hypothetical protein SAMN05444506_101266 [Pseudomonas syringae]
MRRCYSVKMLLTLYGNCFNDWYFFKNLFVPCSG